MASMKKCDCGVIVNKSCANCDNDKPSGLPVDCAFKCELLKRLAVISFVLCYLLFHSEQR